MEWQGGVYLCGAECKSVLWEYPSFKGSNLLNTLAYTYMTVCMQVRKSSPG